MYMEFTPIIAAWLWHRLLLSDWPVKHPAIEYINPCTHRRRPHAKTIVAADGKNTDVIFHRMHAKRHGSITVRLTVTSTSTSHRHVSTNIHRHQTPPRYRHTVHGQRVSRHLLASRLLRPNVTSSIKPEVHNVGDWDTTATGDLHTKFCEDQSSGSRDMLADRQTDIQTDRLITILHTPTGADL